MEPFNFDTTIGKIGEARSDLQSLEARAHPKSKIASLEQLLPPSGFTISRLLHSSIHQAADSLDLVISIISSRRAFPVMSGYSLARSAMLASARCLWVLLPEHLETSTFRAKVILKDELRMLNKALNTGDGFEAIQGISMEPASRTQLEKVLNTLGAEVPHLKNENMLREVAEEIEAWLARGNPDRAPGSLAVEEALYLWNLGSASAHGQGYVYSFVESAPELFKTFCNTIDSVSTNTALASWKLRESFLGPIPDEDCH